MAYFPMFMDITDKKCLVIGGGNVALRKVRMLLDFGAKVDVISLKLCGELEELIQRNPGVQIAGSEYCKERLQGATLVIAATDDNELNRTVAAHCRQEKIPVNVVDTIEECSFILPAYVRNGDVVAAFSSSGKSPVVAQYLKNREKEILTEELGDINDTLGNLRGTVKETFRTEAERKAIYEKILEMSLEKNRALTEEEIQELVHQKRG